MSRYLYLALLLAAALILLPACNGGDDEGGGGGACPLTGVPASGGSGDDIGTAYQMSVGTTYVSSITSIDEYFEFVAPTTGYYTGCLGTTVVTDLGFNLYGPGGFGDFIGDCDDYWEDERLYERCSTAEVPQMLSSGTTYYVEINNYGPITSGGTYAMTVTTP